MAVKFFGQFLVEKGIISREKLLEALDLQQETNLKFGEMALSMGLITARDVDRVHQMQRSDDLRFGDIAVKIGILTEAQVEQVLTKQKNSYLYIGGALVKLGALSEMELEHHLKAFQADQAPYCVDRIEIPAGVPTPDFWEMAADLTFKMLTRVADLHHRSEAPRLIDRIDPNFLVATIEFTGAVKGSYSLSVSPEIRTAIARGVLKETNVENEPEEVLDDTVMEFVNIVCGNVAAKGAQLGHAVDIAPPEAIRPEAPIEIPNGHIGVAFPVHAVCGGRMEVILCANKWGF